MILPTDIAASADPILHARSAAYSVSFNRTERDIVEGKFDQARSGGAIGTKGSAR